MPPEPRVTAAAPSSVESMRRHVEALFTRDARGRLVLVDDGEGRSAPRFFLGRTRDACRWWFGAGLPSDVAEELERVCRDEPPIGRDPERDPARRDEYLRILAADADVRSVSAGRCYGWPAGSAPGADTPPGFAVHTIDESNVGVLRAHMADWIDVALQWQPMVVSLHGGHAVSVCASVRRTDEAHEAGVGTASAFRRRGFARAAVARWAAEVGRLGVEPLYSNAWDNLASQRLAASLRLTMFGADFQIS